MRDEGQVRCPECSSAQLTSNKKGFGLGKAAVGLVALGPVGLLGGLLGSGKIRITCLNCAHSWVLGKSHVVKGKLHAVKRDREDKDIGFPRFLAVVCVVLYAMMVLGYYWLYGG